MENSVDGDETLLDVCPDIIEEKIQKKVENKTIIKRYKKGKFLGKGGFAKCYEIHLLDSEDNIIEDKIYAVKVVSKNNLNKSQAQQKLKSEIKIHKILIHKHIVKFEHVFEDSDNVYIILELCPNKTLNEILKKRKIITEIELKYFLDQILKAVSYMHKNKVVHRDLKLGNLFLNENMEIKIGDFGLATTIEFQGQLRTTVCGTPNYIAPEILGGKNTGHSYEVDFWAIGVIIFTLLTGRPPFETDDVKETYKRIKSNKYSFPNNIYISNEAKDFISKLLVLNPQDRININQMREHIFLQNIKLPIQFPETIKIAPPDSAFLRNIKIDEIKIKSVLDESFLINNEEYQKNLENVKEFMKSNLNFIKQNDKNLHDKKFINLDENELIENIKKNNNDYQLYKKSNLNYKSRIDPISNMKYLINFNDISYSKEFNKYIKKKESKKISTNIIIDIIDYRDKFGIAYKMNNDLVGIIFNDKSLLFFENNIYRYKKTLDSKISEFNINTIDDLDDEIRDKIQFLDKAKKGFPKNDYSDKFNSERKFKNNVYVKKMIISNLAFFFKLSNNFIQIIYYDKSVLIIGDSNNSDGFYINKNQDILHFNSHNINKLNHRNLNKRYEHYKKIFYENLEKYDNLRNELNSNNKEFNDIQNENLVNESEDDIKT